MKNGVVNKTLIFLLFAVHFELLLNIIFKYYVNSLSLENYQLTNTGNIINLSITVLLVVGIIIHLLATPDLLEKYKYTYTSAAFVVLLPYLFIYIFLNIHLEFLDTYLWGYPIRKLWVGFLLLISKGYLLFILCFIWLPFFYNNTLRLRSIIFSFGLIIVLLIFTLLYSISIETNPRLTSYNNVGTVFGAAVYSNNKPSPMFQGRIKKAYDLYVEGRISSVQLTGGNAPGELSEAKSAFNYLVELGVDSNKINIEEQTSNTTEQIKYIHAHLGELIKDRKKIVLISDSFHLPRIMEISDFFGIQALCSSSDHELKWEKLLYYRVRESVALLLFWVFGI